MQTPKKSESSKQVILYYPTISIPSGTWLRQSLLYWDELGSIVPQRYDDTELIPYTPDIQYLKDEGEFRPFRTELLFRREWKIVQEFENELMNAVLSNEFQSMLPPEDKRKLKAKVHQDKVSQEVFEFLRDAKLAKTQPPDHDWYYFENSAALLYMSILAKYLADEDSQATVSGTNLRAYEHLNFHAQSNDSGFNGLSVRFFNILPVPRETNSFPDILDFKRRRRDQLLHFRQLLGETQSTLSACASRSDANDALAGFSNKLEIGLRDFDAVLRDASIATVAGAFETLIKCSSPGWLATAVVASGKIEDIAKVPISWTLSGALIAGAVGVGRYLIDKRNERRALLRTSPFSYLYSAIRENLVQ
jgi:hypothetical protein